MGWEVCVTAAINRVFTWRMAAKMGKNDCNYPWNQQSRWAIGYKPNSDKLNLIRFQNRNTGVEIGFQKCPEQLTYNNKPISNVKMASALKYWTINTKYFNNSNLAYANSPNSQKVPLMHLKYIYEYPNLLLQLVYRNCAWKEEKKVFVIKNKLNFL